MKIKRIITIISIFVFCSCGGDSDSTNGTNKKSDDNKLKESISASSAQDSDSTNGTNEKSDDNKLKVSVSADKVVGGIPDVATLTEFGLTAKSLISQAEQLRDNRKYLDAIKKLEVLLESFPDSPEAPDAQVLIAQIYMGYQNDFSSAVSEFRKVVANFPKSKQAHNAQFMMGYIYANHLDEKEKARTEFQKFIDLYSGEVEEYFLESARAELRSLEEGPPELNIISE